MADNNSTNGDLPTEDDFIFNFDFASYYPLEDDDDFDFDFDFDDDDLVEEDYPTAADYDFNFSEDNPAEEDYNQNFSCFDSFFSKPNNSFLVNYDFWVSGKFFSSFLTNLPRDIQS